MSAISVYAQFMQALKSNNIEIEDLHHKGRSNYEILYFSIPALKYQDDIYHSILIFTYDGEAEIAVFIKASEEQYQKIKASEDIEQKYKDAISYEKHSIIFKHSCKDKEGTEVYETMMQDISRLNQLLQ